MLPSIVLCVQGGTEYADFLSHVQYVATDGGAAYCNDFRELEVEGSKGSPFVFLVR